MLGPIAEVLRYDSSSSASNGVQEELRRRLLAIRTYPAAVEIDVPAIDPLAWLASLPKAQRVLWTDRSSGLVTAGLGVAMGFIRRPTISVREFVIRIREAAREWDALGDVRFYGGFSFQLSRLAASREWSDFGLGRFWLPRLILRGRRLSVYLRHAGERGRALGEVSHLDFSGRKLQPTETNSGTRRDRPDRETWRKHVEHALALIHGKTLEKIVLVRRCSLEMESPADPIAIAAALRKLDQNSYTFLLQAGPDAAFVGASPERLFERRGTVFVSESVAGTRRRGETPLADSLMAAELCTSAKDRLEHAIVGKCIRQRLQPYTRSISAGDEPTVMKLASTQHLHSEVRAELIPGVDDGTLLERLHPTPALGGYPTEEALAQISRLELFDRGWYGGPIGWIEPDAAEFAVGIRSALVRGQKIDLYSGAGIVQGSDADQEWDELEAKIRDLLAIVQGRQSG